MTTKNAPRKVKSTKSNVLGHVTYLRLTEQEIQEARELATADDRTINGFIRTMYRRGLEDFKARRA